MTLINKDVIYLRKDLDILFIALNPPEQSNINGYYFSGSQSTFYKQLYLSGLISKELDKSIADELVFGGIEYNYKNSNYGVIDLVPGLVETNGGLVRVNNEDVINMINRIEKYKPKIVCIIHSKVKTKLSNYINKNLVYGYNGQLLENLDTEFYCNYFPNGNNIPTERKINIYKEIRDKL